MICSRAFSSLLLAVMLGFENPGVQAQTSVGSGTTQLSVPDAKGKEAPPPQVRSGIPVCPIQDRVVEPVLHHAVATHKVTLSWNPSARSSNPASVAAGYCVYRRKESKAGKDVATQNPTFAGRERINSVPVLGTTCVDDEVDDDTIYSYVVTAVNANGIPSSPSNEVTVYIPAEKPKSSTGVVAPSCRGGSNVRP